MEDPGETEAEHCTQKAQTPNTFFFKEVIKCMFSVSMGMGKVPKEKHKSIKKTGLDVATFVWMAKMLKTSLKEGDLWLLAFSHSGNTSCRMHVLHTIASSRGPAGFALLQLCLGWQLPA